MGNDSADSRASKGVTAQSHAQDMLQDAALFRVLSTRAAGACSTWAMQASDAWPACVHGRYLRGVTRWSVVLLREPEDGRPKDSDLRLRAPLVVASAGRAGRSSKRRRCVRLPWHRCMAVVATSGHAHPCGVPLWWLWIACQSMACHQVMRYLAMGTMGITMCSGCST